MVLVALVALCWFLDFSHFVGFVAILVVLVALVALNWFLDFSHFVGFVAILVVLVALVALCWFLDFSHCGFCGNFSGSCCTCCTLWVP